MPVVLAIVDPETRLAYWVQVTHAAVRYTKRAWSIDILEANVLDARSQENLRGIAFAVTPANADPVDEALPLLPPSAVEMLSALRQRDRDGALRLAKFLSEGREQPRQTVETLLDASRVWTHATALRLATLGAFANEHGHQDLAMTAFALAADRDPSNRARLSAIAGLMAMAAGDRVRAAALLRPAREHAGTNVLADVAVCVFDADETGRDDALETMLRGVPDDELAAERTCLLFLAERAVRCGDLEGALTLYERACGRHPRIVGGRLGKARVLIERIVCGRSALPARDQQEAVELATSVRDDMRRWAGPSENAHRLVVHERMLVGAFNEVIALATPTQFGGRANDREATDPTVAVLGAQACVALGDRTRAGRFGDAVRGTPAEALIRALAADPGQPEAITVGMWRIAFDKVDNPVAARICLHQLALRGALDPADLVRGGALANLDDHDRSLFTARNAAAIGDLEVATELLRLQRSPAAGEMLIEVLRQAGRHDEALAICDETWETYGALKALQDKINILGFLGDHDAAEACAAELLASGELPTEQRSQLHRRLVGLRMVQGDWAGAEARCRAALKDQPGDPNHAWGLITAQLNQNRSDAAWASYRQLAPEVHVPDIVPAWIDLHVRYGVTQETRATAAVLLDRFGDDPHIRAHIARLNDLL